MNHATTPTPHLIDRLHKVRLRLLKAYVIHVGFFFSTCAFAATDVVQIGVTTAMLVTLLTIPPVLIYTVLVHKACREIDPKARTAGVVQIIFFTVFLTPLESGLVLPARNLWVSKKILLACQPVSLPIRARNMPDA
ncbi:MAG: hypothetical protein ACTS9Y_03225 [Methylophilus sp.]|uniref:hypothetical protein n=1 Tax=Methylophilus sp. TaxID=29541 RepID=UPI003F9F37F8